MRYRHTRLLAHKDAQSKSSVKHTRTYSPPRCVSCSLLTLTRNRPRGPYSAAVSLLQQLEKAKMVGGMAARQRGDDGLHMIYIKKGNVRPFMKPSEEGDSALARG